MGSKEKNAWEDIIAPVRKWRHSVFYIDQKKKKKRKHVRFSSDDLVGSSRKRVDGKLGGRVKKTPFVSCGPVAQRAADKLEGEAWDSTPYKKTTSAGLLLIHRGRTEGRFQGCVLVGYILWRTRVPSLFWGTRVPTRFGTRETQRVPGYQTCFGTPSYQTTRFGTRVTHIIWCAGTKPALGHPSIKQPGLAPGQLKVYGTRVPSRLWGTRVPNNQVWYPSNPKCMIPGYRTGFGAPVHQIIG